MMRRNIWGFARNEEGAVAPTVALSIVALIAAGGIAFDYARLATLDTELQGAADQAALAAAGQLDGESGACARAAAAAANLLSNQTLSANEVSSRAITVSEESTCDATGSIQFYQSYNQADDTFGPAAASDAEAKVVLVRVNPREAVYALTPIVGAFRSGNIDAEAIASLGSAVCRVPPVMMCNPAEPDGNKDLTFDFNPPVGAGLRLVVATPDAPGNFGFLRIDEPGAGGVAEQLGYDNPPIGCINASGGVETEPGDMQAVRAAFNSRFDISQNGSKTCPGKDGVCSPSANSRKDLIRSSGCGLASSASQPDWQESAFPYRGRTDQQPLSTTYPMDSSRTYPDIMGYPRDLCHATSIAGSCSSANGGLVGTAAWDIDAYFKVNYNWNRSDWMAKTVDADGVPLAATNADVAGVSRYDVYKWEMENPTKVPSTAKTQPSKSGYNAYSTPVCRAPGVTPDSTKADRRRLSVAVVNCEAQDVGGHKKNVQVRKWLDVFLVEPALARPNRATNGDIYVEVIGVASTGANDAENLPTRRDVPYLLR